MLNTSKVSVALAAILTTLLVSGLLYATSDKDLETDLLVFKAGDTISAEEVNSNFKALAIRLAATEAALSEFGNNACPIGYSDMTADPSFEFDSVVATNPDATLCVRGADQMVRVGDFWIDRYESVLVDPAWYNGGLCDSSGIRYGSPVSCTAGGCDDYPASFPDSGQLKTPVYSCSISGHIPSRGLTWFQASVACALSGKHLVTNDEWQTAASGTVDPGESSGTGGNCVTVGAPRKTGGGTTCRSWFGAEDMVGNLLEWVAMWGQGGLTWMTQEGGVQHPWPEGYSGDNFDTTYNINGGAQRSVVDYASGLPSAVRRGGSFDNGTGAGVFAIYANVAPSYTHWTVGARCALR